MLPDCPGSAEPMCCATPFFNCSHPSPCTTGASILIAGISMRTACSMPGVGAGMFVSDCMIGRRCSGISASFGCVLPCASGGVCPEGSTTAMTSGVGLGVAGCSAAATSRFRSRSMPSPLSKTPTSPTTARISTPSRTPSITRRRCDACPSRRSVLSSGSGVSTTAAAAGLPGQLGRHHVPRPPKMFQPLTPGATPFFDQQPAQFLDRQLFGRFTSGHGTGIIPREHRGPFAASPRRARELCEQPFAVGSEVLRGFVAKSPDGIIE